MAYAIAEDQGAFALVLVLAKTFERVSLPVVWALGNALQFPREDIAGSVRVLRAPKASAVRRMCGRAAHDHHGYFASVEVELACFLRIVLQDALSEVTKIYHSLLKLRVLRG